jgi:hypothetical protein
MPGNRQQGESDQRHAIYARYVAGPQGDPAKALLKITWSGGAEGAHYDSASALDDFAAIGRDKSREGVTSRHQATARSRLGAQFLNRARSRPG